MKNAIKTIADSNIEPPAAVHPIKTGIAPVKEPGTTAKAVIFLRFVYKKLYQMMLNNPNNAVITPKK